MHIFFLTTNYTHDLYTYVIFFGIEKIEKEKKNRPTDCERCLRHAERKPQPVRLAGG
jgi:hypothetical protein